MLASWLAEVSINFLEGRETFPCCFKELPECISLAPEQYSKYKLTHFFFLFDGEWWAGVGADHTQWCSGINSGSVLMAHPCQSSGHHLGATEEYTLVDCQHLFYCKISSVPKHFYFLETDC